MNIVSIKSAFNASLQDLGRSGSATFGFPPNGALDQFSHKAANVLVGNQIKAVTIELTLGVLRATVNFPALISVTGGEAKFLINGELQDMWRPVYVYPHDEISVEVTGAELRSYVGVSGYISAETFLDSVSPDRVAGFSSSLEPGASLEVENCLSFRSTGNTRRPIFAAFGAPSWRTTTEAIYFVEGPEFGIFDAVESTLLDVNYEMSQHTDPVGARLYGQTPTQTEPASSRSRTVPIGSIEIPSEGEILVLNRGRGVTAGYPVLGVVTSSGLDALSQRIPGSTVQFLKVELQDSVNELIQQEAWLNNVYKLVRQHYIQHLEPPA